MRLIEKVTFEQRLDGDERYSRKNILERRKSPWKG